MKSIYKSFSAIALIAITSPAFANEFLSKDLMSCTPAGTLVSQCKIPNNLQLMPAQTVESDFYLGYTLSCDRKYPAPVASKITVSVPGSTPITLSYRDKQDKIYVGTGKGPLTIVDSFPNELAFRSFGHCELRFTSLTAQPSASVKELWAEQLAGKQALLISKQDYLRSLDAITLLMPAYEFFRDLADLIQADLTQNAAIIESVKSLAHCENQVENCDVLSRMSLDEKSPLTIAERILISQLRLTLSSLSTETKPMILKDRMSEESIRILEKLASDAEYYEDVKNKIDLSQSEIFILTGEIQQLRLQLGV